jgi:SnoaL-like domain
MPADQIRRTIAQFAHYLDERRWAEWGELFTDDATILHLSGRSSILAFMQAEELGTMPDLFRKHDTTNLIITSSGTEAAVVSDLILHEWLLRMGKYTDRLVPAPDGRRLFADRRLAWTANGLDTWRAGGE